MAKKPCCAADALRRIRQINLNGIPTGINMLDESIREVKELGLTDEREIREALMKQVKIYNYIPPGVQEAYTEAIMREYHAAKKSAMNRGFIEGYETRSVSYQKEGTTI